MWIPLVLLAVVTYSLALVVLGKKVSSNSLKLGLFLSVFDWIFENVGKLLGLWETYKSVLFLGYVPVEVSFIALLAGSLYHILVPKKIPVNKRIIVTLCIALMGTIIEWYLTQLGILRYMGVWNSALAFVSYTVAFYLVYLVNSRIN